jgi:hypothetical protein
MARRAALTALVVIVSWLFALPAHACSPRTHEIGPETVGVFEQKTITAVPGLLFREARSASVVVRYWGEPPQHLGLQLHGGKWYQVPEGIDASCPHFRDVGGAVRYGTPDVGSPGFRATGFVYFAEEDAMQPVRDDLAQLEKWLGPPVLVPVGAAVVVQAFASVWVPTLAGFGAIAGVLALAVSRRRRRSHRRRSEVDD